MNFKHSVSATTSTPIDNTVYSIMAFKKNTMVPCCALPMPKRIQELLVHTTYWTSNIQAVEGEKHVPPAVRTVH